MIRWKKESGRGKGGGEEVAFKLNGRGVSVVRTVRGGKGGLNEREGCALPCSGNKRQSKGVKIKLYRIMVIE